MDKEKVDMYYRFTSDEEPTDEQLAVLMEEVGEDIRRRSEILSRKLLETIEEEYQKAKEYHGRQQTRKTIEYMTDLEMMNKSEYLNKIICGDSLTVMRQMPDKCVDLVITSPPYNLKNSTGNGMKDGRGGKWASAALVNGYSHYDDNMPHKEYAEWQHDCLKEMFRLLKDGGAIFYNHKWRVQDGLIQDRKDIIRNLPVRQIIIWRRKGGINFNPGYFLPTYEVIYLIPKPDFKLAPKANAYGDVWEFTQEMNNEHPAPFPVALIDRIISSTTANTILDPFMGSGTTAIVAMGLKRNYVGIELSPIYCEMAEKRIVKNKIQSEVMKFHPLSLFEEI